MTTNVMKPMPIALQMAWKMPNTMPNSTPTTSYTKNMVHLLPKVASFEALMACIGFLPFSMRK